LTSKLGSGGESCRTRQEITSVDYHRIGIPWIIALCSIGAQYKRSRKHFAIFFFSMPGFEYRRNSQPELGGEGIHLHVWVILDYYLPLTHGSSSKVNPLHLVQSAVVPTLLPSALPPLQSHSHSHFSPNIKIKRVLSCSGR
jgi:hypothetical protein